MRILKHGLLELYIFQLSDYDSFLIYIYWRHVNVEKVGLYDGNRLKWSDSCSCSSAANARIFAILLVHLLCFTQKFAICRNCNTITEYMDSVIHLQIFCI